MKTILKKSAVLSILSFLLISLVIPVFAHPGSLDENGGHYDRSTGEYHYHHGYSAHQHTNGECPYDFHYNVDDDYNPNKNSSSSSSSSYTPTEPTTKNSKYNPDADSSHFDQNTLPIIIGIGLGSLISLFTAWVIFSFISPSIRTKSKYAASKKTSDEQPKEKQEILPLEEKNKESTAQKKPEPILQPSNISTERLKNDSTKLKSTSTTVAPSYLPSEYRRLPPDNYNRLSKEEAYIINRKKIFNELVSFSLSNFIAHLPKGIELNNSFELVYPSSKTKIYGKYTVYIEQKTFVVHQKKSCNSSRKNTRLSLDFSIGEKYTLCLDCWEKTPKSDSLALFMPEWYSNYKNYIKNIKIYNLSIDLIMKEKQKILSEQLKTTEFIRWKPEIHTNIEQIKKIAKSELINIISYDTETKKAQIQGSNGKVYITSFYSCECQSWKRQLIPCKHMYKYVSEYGGIDFSKYI